MTDKIGMLPSCWGSALWHVLATISYVYNPKVDKENYFNFFMNLGNILPCEECRVHYSQNVDKQDLLNALNSNETMFRWVYDLHNKVNQQTGVPESKWPSYESVKKRYSSYESSCSDIPGVCSTKPGTVHKKIKIVEQFGNFSEDYISYIVIGILSFILVISLMYTYKLHTDLNKLKKR
jgi:hypothetical protein